MSINKELLDLVQANLPLSIESQKIFNQTLESFSNDSIYKDRHSSQDPTLVPIFCAKFLNALEKEGVKIEALDSPGKTWTYRCSNLDFSGYLDLIGIDIEPMIISKLVEIAVLDFKEHKTVSIYSVIPYIDHENKNAFIFIRGTELNLKEK